MEGESLIFSEEAYENYFRGLPQTKAVLIFAGCVKSLLERLPSKMFQLQIAIEGGDSDQVGEIAHQLKGSFRTVGSPILGDLCQHLERDSKGMSQAELRGDLARMAELLPKFEFEVRGFVGRLNERSVSH